MKHLLYCLFALFLVSFLVSGDLIAKKPKLTPEQMLFNSAQGREFWIAIPSNEQPNFTTHSLEIYITSAKATNVRLELPSGQIINKQVKPFQITTISTETGDIGWDLEIWESERITEQGIHITADQPLSVYVLNAKLTTSDGYLALPVNALGTEYIHNSYYDFNEVYPWATGFVIVAANDFTRVRIELRGKGKGFAKTWGGRDIGDVIQIDNMMAGQTYYVRGDAKTAGMWDISGSRITSNKPIGLISTHQRARIPTFDLWNGRDHLSEMMPPVTAWGKKYYTVSFVRESGMGDYFRIIAAEDKTTWSVKWYDKVSKELIGQTGGQLNAGGFAEYLNITALPGQPHEPSIVGTSIWEANKPVLVMQYAYSCDWDGDAVFDPLMVLVVPVEQYIPKTVFQTPANTEFQNNYFNIIAIGDTTDPSRELLKSVKFDDQPIYVKDPKFLYNQIPGTDLFWSQMMVVPGAHRVEGDTKFGGYIYGFSNADSYGWPAAMAINKIDETDTVPPTIDKTGECGNYKIHSTEVVFGAEGDDPRQMDQGISEIELLPGSFNYELYFPNTLVPWPALRQFDYELHVTDNRKDGFAKFYCMDRYGNANIDSVYYFADKLELKPKEIKFGDVRLKKSKQLDAMLTNVGGDSVLIKSIELARGEVFRIINGGTPPEFLIASNEDHRITIEYTPKNEGLTDMNRDRDSIIIKTECARYSWPIDGRGVVPRITVEDWNAGAVVVNGKVCFEQQNGRGLEIRSLGTMPVVITDIVNTADGSADFKEFSLTNVKFTVDGIDKMLPLTLKPNEKAFLTSLCFSPPGIDDYEVHARFVCDADGIKDTSIWRGSGIIPGPRLTSKDWFERRVKTLNDSVVVLTNEGNTSTWVTGFVLSDPSNPNFQIVSTNPPVSKAAPVNLVPKSQSSGVKEILVNVRFTPQAEFQHDVIVIAEFNDQNIEPGSIIGELRGFGILPKIEVTGYEFVNPILVGSSYDDTQNYPLENTYITIKSTSETADLYIEKILPIGKGANPSDFTWKSATPADIIIPRGSSITVPVRFTPSAINDRRAIVEVVSDAATGPDVDPRVTTEADLLGHAFETGIENDSINYGNVILCDNPVANFAIRNTSRTTKTTIESVTLTSGDMTNFEILSTFPMEIGPEGSINVQVKFLPSDVSKCLAYATIKVQNSDEIYLARLEGVGYNIPAKLSLHKYTANDKITPGDVRPLRVSAECPNWLDAGVTKISFDIVYERKWMKFTKQAAKGNLLTDKWLMGFNEIYDPSDPEHARLRVTLVNQTGNDQIDNKYSGKTASLVDPAFVMLLSDVTEFKPWIENISFDSRDECIVPSSEPGNVVLNACVINLRVVDDIKGQYMLQPIKPNPVTSDLGAKVLYNVALEDRTVLKVFNSNGEEVSTLVDEIKKPGNYEATIPVNGLSSGVYFVRMSSGPFKEVQNFVISK